MKKISEFVVSAFVTGLLLVVPIYLAVLLLLKAMQSAMTLVRPFAMLFPAWLPAEHLLSLLLVLLVCFLIEELADGRFTVFVPSVPTPFAGAVYILSRERVHPLEVPFTQALQSISRWGSGSKELVAAMKPEPTTR